MPWFTVYSALVLAAVAATALVWWRLVRAGDRRLALVYIAGLLGAVVGAKLAFLFAEGWHYRDDYWALLSGRSITGGLLGGYAGVELAKWWLGYRAITGDLFAIIVPIGIAIGRVGCLVQGCCPGVTCEQAWWSVTDHAGTHRWPAAAVELAFNGLFLGWALIARRRGWLPGNLFHVYLIAYGVFRFGHEFLRDDQRMAGSFGGYHIIAAGMAAFGLWRFIGRRRMLRSAGARPLPALP